MALIIAFAITFFLVPIALRIAPRVGLIDHPGPLKVQHRPIPYGGGIAVFVAIAVPVAIARPSLLVPLALAAGLGLADDLRDLPVGIRVVAELAIGVLVAWVVAPHDLAHVALGVVVAPVLLNAANLLDGLDALLASVATISALGFYVVLAGGPATLALALAGALAAFLLWNRPPARIYLGDAGSYLVGTALAIMFVAAAQRGAPATGAAVLFVGVPVGDTVIAILRRIRAHRPVLQGDRGHVYDQLVDRGWSVPGAVMACALGQLALTAIGVSISDATDNVAIAVVAATVALVGITAVVAFTSPRTWATDR
jgi:UDP-GlcNAc:undecaprenyl-phosphate GlcNAc-1-phosphate transferase